MKSEPDEFSIDDLARVGTEPWSGVRNYQARNYMWKTMRVGDGVFFYHSNADVTGIAGIVEVVREGYPDPSAFDAQDDHYDPRSRAEAPTWYCVDVRLLERFAHVIPLPALKANPALADLALVQRGNRLSVMPVSATEWQAVLALRHPHLS